MASRSHSRRRRSIGRIRGRASTRSTSAREYFNGRGGETEDLLRRVVDAPVTVLFGKSGLGKTSLLRAGLFPRLREKHFLPVHVRLDVRRFDDWTSAALGHDLRGKIFLRNGQQHGPTGAQVTQHFRGNAEHARIRFENRHENIRAAQHVRQMLKRLKA